MAEEQNSWTEERLVKLRELWDKGLSISAIGEELGVTRNAIAGKAHRLGLPKRQSPISSKKAAATQAVIEEPQELPLRLALRKLNWSRSKCVWPTGDPKHTDFHFCGAPILAGKPYCPDHCIEAYTTSRDG
ncbi:MAG: GcrA family cell cycle regulator [Candidatus Puniceispirillaceae bacterium]